MKCKDVTERLSAFYDAELSEADSAEVLRHLESCAECAQQRDGFIALTGMVGALPEPPLPTDDWQPIESQLSERTDGPCVVEQHAVEPAGWFPQIARRFRRPAMAIAALALVLLVWLGTEYWGGFSGQQLMAADFAHYVENLQNNPEVAQRELLTRFNGRQIEPSVAAQTVNYRPAAVRTLPSEYTLESVYSLKMPCCDCLQTVCRRSDATRIAIFEYAEEQPVTYGDGQQTMMQCRNKSCCLVNVSEHLAVTWNDGGRQITAVGVRDRAEIDNLVAWLE